jgi:Carboxypeptidase regulatory-like domain
MPNGPVTSNPSGHIVGHVELAEGVPAAGAKIRVQGTPIGATCDADGNFDVPDVPGGAWKLRVTHPLTPASVRRVPSNVGEVTDAGTIRLRGVGSIRGRVMFLNPDDQATAVIAVPEQGIATQPNAAGGYLLNGVAAGDRQVVLLHARYGTGASRMSTVAVQALTTVNGPDFIQRPPRGPDPIDFGSVIIGSSSQTNWNLSNPDGVAATLDSGSISGPDAAKFQIVSPPVFPMSVPASGRQLPLALDTTSLGTFAAELRIEGIAEGMPFAQVAAIKAVVVPPPSVPVPVPQIIPAELDFGSLSSVSVLSVELKNEGDVAANFYILTSTGPFQVINPPFPLSIPAHGSQQIIIEATSPGLAGPVSGLIKFLCEPGNQAVSLNLTAVWS